MTFMIATRNRSEDGLRISRFENGSAIPRPGDEVVVSLPERGAHAIGRVDHVDPAAQTVYLDVDEDSRVWS